MEYIKSNISYCMKIFKFLRNIKIKISETYTFFSTILFFNNFRLFNIYILKTVNIFRNNIGA